MGQIMCIGMEIPRLRSATPVISPRSLSQCRSEAGFDMSPLALNLAVLAPTPSYLPTKSSETPYLLLKLHFGSGALQ